LSGLFGCFPAVAPKPAQAQKHHSKTMHQILEKHLSPNPIGKRRMEGEGDISES
jgi:hypothetical protein